MPALRGNTVSQCFKKTWSKRWDDFTLVELKESPSKVIEVWQWQPKKKSSNYGPKTTKPKKTMKAKHAGHGFGV